MFWTFSSYSKISLVFNNVPNAISNSTMPGSDNDAEMPNVLNPYHSRACKIKHI